MRIELLFGGIGGQGIRLMGDILAATIVEELDMYATLVLRYTPEVRGGTIHVEVVISDEPIDYPRVIAPDITIILHEKSYLEDQEVMEAVHEVLKAIKNRYIISDARLAVHGPGIHLDLSGEASKISERAYNMLALGVVVGLLKKLGIPIEIEHVINVVKRKLRRGLEQNIAALKRGFEIASQTTPEGSS